MPIFVFSLNPGLTGFQDTFSEVGGAVVAVVPWVFWHGVDSVDGVDGVDCARMLSPFI